jgi:transposase-like protein
VTEIAQKPRSFQWTAKKEQAALLIAQDDLTIEEVADEVKVARNTLLGWRKHPDFAQRIGVERERIIAAIRKRGIAVPELRVKALQDRWRRMTRVIEERGVDPAMANIPGGSTGMLVRWVKSQKIGDKTEIIEEEFKFDAGLCAELRAHEKQAAQELGQWSDKHQHTGPNGEAMHADVHVNVFTGNHFFDEFGRAISERILPASPAVGDGDDLQKPVPAAEASSAAGGVSDTPVP